MTTFTGTSGADTFTGTDFADKFVMGQGGDDHVSGGKANDTFAFGGALTAADTIDGGDGEDVLTLSGDYTGANALVLGPTTLVSVEQISFAAGHSYDITTDDNTIPNSGGELVIHAQGLGAGETLTFDGGAETNGVIVIVAGAGNDVITTGAREDPIRLSHGGEDTVHAGAGNDYIAMGASLDAGDRIDGGADNDVVVLAGNTNVAIGADTFTSIERLLLTGTSHYVLSTADGVIAAGQSLVVDGRDLGVHDYLHFDGSQETDGSLRFYDGAGNDSLTGGAMDDTFNLVGGGADTANGGGGSDSFTIDGSGVVTINGGAGDDTITYHRAVNSSDMLDGGAGNNTLVFNGDFSAAAGMQITHILTNIQTVKFKDGFDYDIAFGVGPDADIPFRLVTFNGAALSASHHLTIDTSDFYSHAYDPPNDYGHVVLTGGAGGDWLRGSNMDDVINGGGGGDTIIGGNGPDSLSGGAGADTFQFQLGDSQNLFFDTLKDFDATQDFLSIGEIPTSFASPIATNMSSSNLQQFEADLTHDLAGLAAGQAVIYTVTGGSYAGHVFLFVNTSNGQGYSASDNFFIDVTHATHMDQISTDNFI